MRSSSSRECVEHAERGFDLAGSLVALSFSTGLSAGEP
jgi:hypothetical protein